tara:strand:- start:83 stop:487 length:405 start_codon:yes stop_codon:yes gene_type:complete
MPTTEQDMQNGALLGIYKQFESSIRTVGSAPDEFGKPDVSNEELYGFLLADIAISLRQLSQRLIEEDPFAQYREKNDGSITDYIAILDAEKDEAAARGEKATKDYTVPEYRRHIRNSRPYFSVDVINELGVGLF